MTISKERMREIYEAAAERGVDYAAEFAGITRETARRYLRNYRAVTGLKKDGKLVNDLAPTFGKHAPKILLVDVETSPNLGYVWSFYEQNIAPNQVIGHSEMLCWAAKWLGGDAVMCESREHDPNDARICRELWELFDQADVVVAHNGIAFDEKFLNLRWLDLGMEPPSPYRSVDTLKILRKRFRFQMNKLDYVARYLELGEKLEHEGFELWLKCMAGDPAAWNKMREYNIRDTYLLELVYKRIRAWDKRAPNISLMYDDNHRRCLVCGCTELKEIPQATYTSVSVFPTFRCRNCGKTMRGRKRDKPIKEILANAI
jgi:hypothetical protein